MAQANVVIVDYGIGNLWSVASALRYLGHEPLISNEPKDVLTVGRAVVPGDGSYRRSMQELEARGFADALRSLHLKQQPLLGICVGMQLFASYGSEDGGSKGLGFIPGSIDAFDSTQLGSLKVPHIGFNLVHAPEGSRLFRGLAQAADFYFVHSYRLREASGPGLYAMAHYGESFAAAYEHEHICATQFHPEKSQTNGLIVLRNFMQL